MDPDTDYGDGQQDQQQGPPPVFTQADDLRLQKLQQGLSSAQDQVDQGVLHPEEADQFGQEIGARIAPLMQRQQAAQAYAKQQATQQAMEQSALVGAIDHQDSAMRMEGLLDKIKPHVDPATGATGYFFESRPGHVEQVDPSMYFPLAGMMQVGADQGGENPGELKGIGAPSGISIGFDPNNPAQTVATPSYVSPGGSKDTGAASYQHGHEKGGGIDVGGGVKIGMDYPEEQGGPSPALLAPGQGTDKIPASDAWLYRGGPLPPGVAPGTPGYGDAAPGPETTPAAQPAIKSVQAQPDGSHVMTIQNGQTVEQWQFDRNGTTRLISRQGPQAQQAEQGMPGSLVQPHEQAAAFEAAKQALAPYKPDQGNYANTPAGRNRYAQDLNQWGLHVATHARGYINALETQRRQQQTQGAIGTREQQAQQFKEAEAKRHEQVMQARQEDHQFGADVDKEVQARVGNWHKTHPDVQDMDESIRQKIEQDAEDTVRKRPQWREHAKWGPQGARASNEARTRPPLKLDLSGISIPQP